MVEHFLGWVRRRSARRRRFNPYIAGAPVFDRQLFFGREALTRRALELVGFRSLRITGERRIGKTSFLYRLRSLLASDTGRERRFCPVFLDLETLAGAGLLRAMMEETVDAVAPTPRIRAGLRVSRTHGEYELSDLSHDLRVVLDDLRAHSPRPVSLVLLVDEVDALRPAPSGVGDAWLGSLLKAFPQELRVVVAGVGANAITGAPGASWFEDLALPPLTLEDAEALVEKPVAPLYRYDRRATERILDISRLRPYRIQQLCLHAVNRMLDGGRTTVREADVVAAPDSGHAESPPTATFERDEQRAN